MQPNQSCGSYDESTTYQMVCDFCSQTPATTRYPARSFISISASLSISSIGDWAACAPCADLIERDEREALAERTACALFAGWPDLITALSLPDLRETIAALHAEFFSARIGPAQQDGISC